MRIENVRVKLFDNTEGKAVKASASINFENLFVVHDIRVLDGERGLFIAFPSRKNKDDDKYLDIAHPISADFRKECQEAVLAEYKKVLETSATKHETTD